jgi:hypothetical protein
MREFEVTERYDCMLRNDRTHQCFHPDSPDRLYCGVFSTDLSTGMYSIPEECGLRKNPVLFKFIDTKTDYNGE